MLRIGLYAFGALAVAGAAGACATLEDQSLFDSASGGGVSVYFYETNVLGVCCGMKGQAYNSNTVPVCVEMRFGGGRGVATVPSGQTVDVYRTDVTGWSGTPSWSMWDPRERACA